MLSKKESATPLQNGLPVIDADAHVIETEHTWDYLEASEQKFTVQVPPESVNNWAVRNPNLVKGSTYGLNAQVVENSG